MKWYTVARDESVLRDLYERQQLTTYEIAEMLGASPALINNRLREFGITRIRRVRAKNLPVRRPRREQPPDPATLRDLYERQCLSAREIGEMFGLTSVTIGTRLHKYNIPIKPPSGPTTRRLVPPTRDELDRFIHVEHRTYAEVGRMYGVSERVVSKWIGEYGIRRPTIIEAQRKGDPLPPLDAVILRRLYESGLSTTEIAARCERSQRFVVKMCKECGISVRPAGWQREHFTGTDGHAVQSTYEVRVCNWLSSRDVPHSCGPRLPLSSFRGDFLVNGWYIEIWGVEKNAVYDARRVRKEAHYRSLDLPLISVERHDFHKRNDRINRVLRPCLQAPWFGNSCPLFPD